ncbi:hypothetical protein [Streptomyces sp. BA2]|uniref:hypothetical protein n=1 Tax=Streptomyces sp. BA2 TaxID=436595 RepID=UPI001325F3AF|nr:hypothetical protein [Streptomyces sp. BA2]MWA08815.1 hypothetical protein [Streptomyces sp. BA2]
MSTDPRIRQLARRRQDMAHEEFSGNPSWEQLRSESKAVLLFEAEEWLRAAVEAGIAPTAERPSRDHSAVWVDEEGFLYGEYQTSPPTLLADAAILRLVWAGDVCSSKREMENQGAEFRLIGWSQ